LALGAAATQGPADSRREAGAKALKILSAAGKHDNADIRALAAEQWGLIGSPAAAPLLKEALEDVNPYVRIAAGRSLFALGDSSGVKTVEKIVATVPKPAQTDEKLAALEEMRLLARNKVRVVGIRALAAMGSTTSVKVLMEARDGADGGVRDASTLALVHLGAADFKSFVDALSSEDPEIREKAAHSLAEITAPDILSDLEPLVDDKESSVRAAAMEALGATKSPEAVPSLRKGFGDQSELVRAKAVEAAGSIPGSDSLALLREALKSANGRVELLAILGLARQGQAVDAALAERALAQPDIDTRMLAMEVLENAGGERAFSALERALDDRDPKVRVRASAALLKILRKPR
jgi:HEAT repeat protein